MDHISEVHLSLINPQLGRKIQQMAVMLEQEKISLIVTQALRSWQDQDRLYAQGRTAPGKIVTNAKGGESWHNYGLAVDICPSLDLVHPRSGIDWNPEHEQWKRMVAVGESLGLFPGAHFRTFPDWPHFQLPGKFPDSPNDEVKHVFREAGMIGVWQEAGLFDG